MVFLREKELQMVAFSSTKHGFFAMEECNSGAYIFGKRMPPVVNWMSVRVLLILALLHNLQTRSIDFVLAFPQTKLESDVFMELPIGMNFGGCDSYIVSYPG